MKRLFAGTWRTALLRALAGTSSWVCAAAERDGEVDFGTLPLPGLAGESVEVRIKSNLIAMAARLVERRERNVAELLRGLKTRGEQAGEGVVATVVEGDRGAE